MKSGFILFLFFVYSSTTLRTQIVFNSSKDSLKYINDNLQKEKKLFDILKSKHSEFNGKCDTSISSELLYSISKNWEEKAQLVNRNFVKLDSVYDFLISETEKAYLYGYCNDTIRKETKMVIFNLYVAKFFHMNFSKSKLNPNNYNRVESSGNLTIEELEKISDDYFDVRKLYWEFYDDIVYQRLVENTLARRYHYSFILIPTDAFQFNSRINFLISEKQNEEILKQRDIIIVFVSISVLCLVVMSFLFFNRNTILKKLVITKKEIESVNYLLKEKNHEITDSINYSKRIQSAILPDISEIKSNLKEVFVFYKPKDIVSGDFYYFNKVNADNFIAVADCTGHGVPGAFMSLVGSKELKIANSQSNSPAKILALLNNGVKETLKQNQIDGTKDGMDIALLKINGNKITYSGANRALWIVQKDAKEITEIKATKTAIAGHTEDNKVFEEHELDLNSGDCIYLSSDGYADQFGGDKQKKMTTKRFKDLLLSIQTKSMEEQQIAIEKYFIDWKGEIEQVDDILVIGIRI